MASLSGTCNAFHAQTLDHALSLHAQTALLVVKLMPADEAHAGSAHPHRDCSAGVTKGKLAGSELHKTEFFRQIMSVYKGK